MPVKGVTKNASRILGGAIVKQIKRITQTENDKVITYLREQEEQEKSKAKLSFVRRQDK